MLLLLFLLALTLAAELPPDVQAVKLTRGNCPLFFVHFNGCCYKYIATRLTWADAELNCVSRGANLVSIHSLEENNFVTALIKYFDAQQGFTWIGLTDSHKEGAWMWSDGSRVKFGHWFPGEPNNQYENEDCVNTNFGNNRQWNDEVCAINKYSSVCKLCSSCY